MGASRWFFTFSGVILIDRGGGAVDQGAELRHRLRVRHPDHRGAGKADRRGRVKKSLEEAGVDNAEVQQVTVPHFGSNVFQIESAQLQPGKVHKAEAAARRTNYGIASEGFESTSVGPTFGNQVAESAVKALIFSLLVIWSTWRCGSSRNSRCRC